MIAPAAHEQKPFVEDVGKGMSSGAVDGEGGADTDSCNHVTDLTDDLPAKQPADIVFNNGVDDAVDRHRHAKIDQDIKARRRPWPGYKLRSSW